MFGRQGFVAPINVKSNQSATDAMHRLDQLQNNAYARFGEAHQFKLHLLEKRLFDIVTNAVIVNAVSQALGSGLLCWSSDVFAKPAEIESFVSTHHDTTYAGLTPHDQIITAWLVIKPSTSISACLQAIPRSHRLGQLSHFKIYYEANLLYFGQTA